MKLSRYQQAPRSRRGGAMVAALLVVFAVATMGMIHVQLDLSKAREQRGAVDSKRAFYMAEAGLAEGFHGIAMGKSGNVGTAEEPARFANGVFFTTADEEGDGRVTLTSTGLCGAGRATLSIVIERTSESAASRGFFGDEQVTVEGGALVDSYDSRVGEYQPPGGQAGEASGGARVGCNGSVQVGGSSGVTVVYGDARPGPEGVLVRGRNTTITGTTAPYLTATALPPIEVPSYPSQGSVVTTLFAPLATLAPGDRSYWELHVGRLGKMTILGPSRIVVDQLRVDKGGELVINAADGPVKIYVTGNMNLAKGSKLSTPARDPIAVSLLVSAEQPAGAIPTGTPPPIQLATTGSFYGTIYAPSANVSIPGTMQVFGAASANRLTVQSNAKLHFDLALLIAGSEEGSLPSLLGWRLIELPDVAIVKLRYDALAELEKAGVDVKHAKNAHFEVGELAARVLPAKALLHKRNP